MSDATHSGRRDATLRQLKVLVVLLVLSNIGLGVFGFYSLRAIDRKYSRLIDQTVPALKQLEEITASAVEAMRNTNPNLASFSQDRLASLGRTRAALDRDRDLRSRVVHGEWGTSGAHQLEALQAAGEAFNTEMAGVVALLDSERTAEANQVREERLRPAFIQYLEATTKAASTIAAESLRTSETLSARTGSISDILLGVAGWPFLALGVVLLSIIVIMLLIRVFLFGEEGVT